MQNTSPRPFWEASPVRNRPQSDFFGIYLSHLLNSYALNVGIKKRELNKSVQLWNQRFCVLHIVGSKWNMEKSAPSVKRLHSQVHELAEGQCDGLVRSSIEGRHLVHNTLGMVPVSNSKQRFQKTELLVIRWLWVQNRAEIENLCVIKYAQIHSVERSSGK